MNGRLTIVVVDPNAENAEQSDVPVRLGRWVFTADQLEEYFDPIGSAQGYRFELGPFHSAPVNNAVTLFVRLEYEDGRKLINQFTVYLNSARLRNLSGLLVLDNFCRKEVLRMPYGLYLSAAGANVQNHRLEVLSHNLANVNTPGFKPELAIMQARHSEEVERGEISSGSGTLADISGGVSFEEVRTVYQQGPVQQTKRLTDFAINDNTSFFVVQRGEEELLTRAGDFLFDSQGQLTTTNGDPVLSTAGTPIQIDPTKDYQVHDDGRIIQNGATQVLRLARPQQPGDLTRAGDNLFRPLAEITNVPQNERQLRSGFLEQSAVKPTSAMMELIEASRLYEANLRMIQHQDQAIGGLVSRLLKE